MPNAPRLEHEASDAPLRVTHHVDHGAAAREAVLVRGLEHAQTPVVHVEDELPLLDLPGVRRIYLVAPVIARVLGELRRCECGGVGARVGHRLRCRADDHARRAGRVSLEAHLASRSDTETAAVEGHVPCVLDADARVTLDSRAPQLTA